MVCNTATFRELQVSNYFQEDEFYIYASKKPLSRLARMQKHTVLQFHWNMCPYYRKQYRSFEPNSSTSLVPMFLPSVKSSIWDNEYRLFFASSYPRSVIVVAVVVISTRIIGITCGKFFSDFKQIDVVVRSSLLRLLIRVNMRACWWKYWIRDYMWNHGSKIEEKEQ